MRHQGGQGMKQVGQGPDAKRGQFLLHLRHEAVQEVTALQPLPHCRDGLHVRVCELAYSIGTRRKARHPGHLAENVLGTGFPWQRADPSTCAVVAKSLASKSGRLVAMLVYMACASGMPGSYLRVAKASMAVESRGGSSRSKRRLHTGMQYEEI
eukprot:349262-Pelagomonas_calceolata.AAC.3